MKRPSNSLFALSSSLQQFELHALDIARASQASARSKYEVAESMALSTTSLALDKDLTFPNVTLPDFEVQSSNARELADLDLMVFCPFVTRGQEQAEWGSYVVQEQGWLRESLDYLGLEDVEPGQVSPEVQNTRNFNDPSYNDGFHVELEDRMAPTW